MPVRVTIPPGDLLEIFKAAGYTLVDEGMDNWVVAKGDKGVPFLIPKRGHAVGRDIIGEACSHDKDVEQGIADFIMGTHPTVPSRVVFPTRP